MGGLFMIDDEIDFNLFDTKFTEEINKVIHYNNGDYPICADLKAYDKEKHAFKLVWPQGDVNTVIPLLFDDKKATKEFLNKISSSYDKLSIKTMYVPPTMLLKIRVYDIKSNLITESYLAVNAVKYGAMFSKVGQ